MKNTCNIEEVKQGAFPGGQVTGCTTVLFMNRRKKLQTSASANAVAAELFKTFSKRKYLDPKLDPGFKRLLKNRAAMISFLNAILRLGKDKISKVEFMDTQLNIHAADLLTLQMDIHAKTEGGLHINVEMQGWPNTFFKERVILQESAFLCHEKTLFDAAVREKIPTESENDKAEREKHRYEIPHVYAVWICNFDINGTAGYYDCWNFYSEHAVAKSAKGEAPLPISPKVKYIIIDLKKFRKKESELKCDEHRWLYLIKNAAASTQLPKFHDSALDNAVKRITVNTKRDKKILEDQVACTMSLDEQMGRLALARVEAREALTRRHVENALHGNVLTVQQIAEYNEVSVSYVRKVKAEMLAGSKK